MSETTKMTTLEVLKALIENDPRSAIHPCQSEPDVLVNARKVIAAGVDSDLRMAELLLKMEEILKIANDYKNHPFGGSALVRVGEIAEQAIVKATVVF